MLVNPLLILSIACSKPSNLSGLLEYSVNNNIALVIATTGFSEEEENKRTKTLVKELTYDERITEIAIMLSGMELSSGILQTAKMMLDSFKG